jgi:hypothetical protein
MPDPNRYEAAGGAATGGGAGAATGAAGMAAVSFAVLACISATTASIAVVSLPLDCWSRQVLPSALPAARSAIADRLARLELLPRSRPLRFEDHQLRT